MSLTVKTARSSLIASGVILAMRPINFIVSIILARLLDPADFGIVALAMVLIATSNLFTGFGMGQALIHSREQRLKIVFPSFLVVMLASLFFFLLVRTNSVWLADVLGDRQVAPVLDVLSFAILLNGLGLIPLSLLRKDMLFGRIGVATMAAELSYALLVVVLAYLGYGYWSIVYAQLARTGVNAALYWFLHPGRDWLIPTRWDWAIMGRLLRYGLQTMTNGFVAYFHTNIDDWIVGRFLGTRALGFYNTAFDFSNTMVGNLGRQVINNVFFPAYAKVQDDKERLARGYLKSFNLTLLVMTPIALGILVAAPDLVAVILGEKWLPMVTTLQVFAFLILSRPISENCAPLFLAVGLPGYNVRAGFVLIAVMLPLIFLFLGYGSAGVACAVVVANFVGMAYNLYQMNTILPGIARRLLMITLPILTIGLVMMVGVYLVKPLAASMTGGLHTIGALSIMVGTGVIIYTGLAVFAQKELLSEMFQVLIAASPFKRWLAKKRLAPTAPASARIPEG